MPSPSQCPVPENSRRWLDEAFPLLIDTFGEENIRTRKVLLPIPADFPIRYDGSIQTAWDTMHIVAAQMETTPEDIQLELYDDGKSSIDSGSPFGRNTSLATYKNIGASAGLYLGRQEDGKYHIWLAKRSLTDPEALVAVLAHEIAHIKLLGDGRLEKNDEMLTDLTTVVFGLGIFNANESFKEYKGFDGWGYSRKGYLKQREWGYALALFAQLREEKDPVWVKHLTPNIRSDFSKSQKYLEEIK